MLTILQAILLGIIQAIAEWLPVSSSGHLALAEKIFGITQPVGYSLLLHLATLFVVTVVLFSDIKKIIFETVKGILKWQFCRNEYQKLGLFIIIATIPAAIAGYMLKVMIEQAFSTIYIIGIGFLVTAFFLWMTKKYTKKGTNKMTYKDALYIGAFQALALIPGISRSGATISAGIFRNIDRELAAKFSFLLFIPAILGATLLEYSSFSFEASELPAIIVGFLVTVLVSYFVIYWLLKLVKKGKLYYFSYYCTALGILTLILSL